MDDFQRKMIESMNISNKKPIEVPERDEMLLSLHSLEMMTVGQADRMFCNSFLSEMIRLITNSIFLYEDGYFDCAFYSLRQAAEVGNNMVFLANKDNNELKKWNKKERFPMNAQLIDQLTKIDEFYSQIKSAIPIFFSEQEALIKKSHKIIHKQGFDTFYTTRQHLAYSKKFDLATEVSFFVEVLKHTIGMSIILYITVDPLSLILTDPELSIRFNFDPMVEAADIDFFHTYLGEDIVPKIKETNFYVEFSSFFAEKEAMLPAVFDVVRNQFFDIDALSDIRSQVHLISMYEAIILEMLSNGLKLSIVNPGCSLFGYCTSIQSNYHKHEWSSSESQQYLESEEVFNQPYHNIFRSIISGIDDNWILDHNEPLTDEEIAIAKSIFNLFKRAYQELLNTVQLDF